MNEGNQKVSVPVFLRKKLMAFRIGKGTKQSYVIKDQWLKQTVDFQPWQFFVLEVLAGCDTFSKLASVFKDRFGHAITIEEVEHLFSFVAEKKLFDASWVSHPMLMAFNKKMELQAESVKEDSGSLGKPESSPSGKINEESLSSGGANDINLDEFQPARGWKLFNPTWLIRILKPLLSPLKHSIYLLPILSVFAFFIATRHSALILEDALRLHDRISFVQHALFSMITVNLASTLVTGIVAYTYRATVSGFCIVFFLKFIPRFAVRLSHLQQLSRREQIWLHASPLLLRIWLFSIGIVVWFNIRISDSMMVTIWLGIAAVSAISFLLTINPLIKSNGYYMISAFLDEPKLREKSYKALVGKMRGTVFQKGDSNLFVAYGLASTLFMVVISAVILYVLGRFLKIYMGGAGILLVVLVSLLLLARMVSKFKKINQLYERSEQFESWRNRTLPEIEDNAESRSLLNPFMTYVLRALLLLFLILLFVPYNYEPGGNFIILPSKRQQITTDLPGIIAEINYDGGEMLKKGDVIGRLLHKDYQIQLKIYTAKMQEQQSLINELKSRPRQEEVELARRALKVEKIRAQFSKSKLSRLEKLYRENTISYEDFDEAQRESEVDFSQVDEKNAFLELAKLGAPSDQILAAEAKLKSLKEERDYYQEKINQSVLYMPFDGKLVSLHLKQKIGSYLDKGDSLAIVENTSQVIAEIDVPETDICYVVKFAKIQGRPLAYHDKGFVGTVTDIDSTVTEKKFGKVVKVITLLENKDGLLKTGMTGYAKISSEKFPVWKLLSLAVLRFVKVEVWSWLP